jgi:regulator of replication initiation timing
MTTEKKAKWVAGAVTGLLLLAMASGVYFYNGQQAYKAKAEDAILKHDSILSVKQLLDREMADLRIELADAKGKSAELDQELIAKENELRSRQEQIDRLVAQNATVQSLRNQLAQLKSEREALNLRVYALISENENLAADNQRLRNSIVTLESEKTALQSKLEATDRSMSRAGNFRVDMLRNNGKVTAKAKRTRDIRVSFDMPVNTAAETSGSKDVYLVVVDPQGQQLKNTASSATTLSNGMVIYPVSTKSVDLAGNPQTVVMDVSLDSKVKAKGIYKVQVFTSEGQIGAAQILMN